MATGNALDIVRVQCPGAAKQVCFLNITFAANQFFSDTECWEKTIETVTVADQADYDLTALLEEFGEVRRIIEVTIGGNPIPAQWYKLYLQTLSFINVIPADVDDLAIKVAVVPSLTVEITPWDGTIPKSDAVLMSESYLAAGAPYTKPISEYALHLLKSMDGVPWANEAQAQKHYSRYISEVARINAQKLNHNTSLPNVMRPGFFA